MLQTPPVPDPAEPGRPDAQAATRAAAAEAQLGLDPSLRGGEKLTRAREHLGLTLEHVADRLRVRRDYLVALETMNMKVLPGRAYGLAYLRSYAAHLGLDPAAIVAQFQNESALTREDVNPQLRNPESKPRRERPWLAAVVIALAAAGFLGWRAYEDLSSDPRLIRPHGAPALVAPQEEASEAPATPATANAEPAAPVAPRVVVELRALQTAWLEVRGPDGTIFFTREMKAGEGYRPDVGAGWTIHAKDGGAFELFVDGTTRGTLGDVGSPVLGRRVDAIALQPVRAPSTKPRPPGQRPPAAPGAASPAQPADTPTTTGARTTR